MPPRVIKYQLTCPLEFTFGSFLIGRRRILVIPRNHLVGSVPTYVHAARSTERPHIFDRMLKCSKDPRTQNERNLSAMHSKRSPNPAPTEQEVTLPARQAEHHKQMSMQYDPSKAPHLLTLYSMGTCIHGYPLEFSS